MEFNNAVSNCDYITYTDWFVMKNEMERMWM
jgi:hypothetical protein